MLICAFTKPRIISPGMKRTQRVKQFGPELTAEGLSREVGIPRVVTQTLEKRSVQALLGSW